ncbi:hypothetical protein QBC37DRAFT_428637 [Rhypophila decipiens]|uniref:Uncharacterized protein n=1 Tax=Rhypophila decipiens TaxID=261697 RepID=A0AAN6Y1K3_9PEZI|nr:hypothetical protein QBC37DRAFT_428637 [Rhypophila decipiens]
MIISSLSFYVRFVPCQAICLLTFILARALHNDAFETPFASFAEILQRPPLLGTVDPHVVYRRCHDW